MLDGLENKAMRMLLERQLDKAGVPGPQKQMMIQAITKDPELFKKIAEEAKAKIDGGMDQQTAMMEVMQAHQSALQAAIQS